MAQLYLLPCLASGLCLDVPMMTVDWPCLIFEVSVPTPLFQTNVVLYELYGINLYLVCLYGFLYRVVNNMYTNNICCFFLKNLVTSYDGPEKNLLPHIIHCFLWLYLGCGYLYSGKISFRAVTFINMKYSHKINLTRAQVRTRELIMLSKLVRIDGNWWE